MARILYFNLATSTSGQLATVPVSNAGSAYTTPPTVTVTGGGATQQAVVRAALTGTSVASFTVTNGGKFDSVPVVRIVAAPGDTTGSGATGTAVLTAGVLTSITLGAAGTLYTLPPQVFLEGGNGGGAAATAVLTGTTVASLSIINPGRDYTSAPTVTITSGGGSSAACASPTVTSDKTAITNIPLELRSDGTLWYANGQTNQSSKIYDGSNPQMNAILTDALTGSGGIASTDHPFGKN